MLWSVAFNMRHAKSTRSREIRKTSRMRILIGEYFRTHAQGETRRGCIYIYVYIILYTYMHVYVCIEGSPSFSVAWVQRITCNYGPCHPPCLAPILCSARYLLECLRPRGMRGKTAAATADNETLQPCIPTFSTSSSSSSSSFSFSFPSSSSISFFSSSIFFVAHRWQTQKR